MGFLLGDYIAVGSLPHYGAMKEEELISFFSALKTPLGTYAVLGNHETWYGRERMKALLAKSGIEVVENKVLKIKGLTLAGLQDYSTSPFERKAMNLFLKENRPHIVLTHKGEILKYAAKTPDFTVFAADTHGGQVRIPGMISLPCLLMRRMELAPGLSEVWGRKLFVTTGAGGHRLNFRLFCPPEIAIVTFKGEIAEK
jgi:predicted MPP superfamily phosphohydrolase